VTGDDCNLNDANCAGHSSATRGLTNRWDADYNRSYFAQVNVATSMSAFMQQTPLKPNFLLAQGDNFYWAGIKYGDDYRWRDRWANVYNKPGFKDLPWYNVMGNHDYGGGSGICGPVAADNWIRGDLCETAEMMEEAIMLKIKAQKDGPSATNTHPDAPSWRMPSHNYELKFNFTDKNGEVVKIHIYNMDTNVAGQRMQETCCQCFGYWPQGANLSNKTKQWIKDNGGTEGAIIGTSACHAVHQGSPGCHASNFGGGSFDKCKSMMEQWWDDGLAEMTKVFSASDADWKIFHNHYMLNHQNEGHFSAPQATQLRAILKKLNVRLFLGGHTHAEGHGYGEDEKVHYFLNGGGGGAKMEAWGSGNFWEQHTYGWISARVSKNWLQMKVHSDLDQTGKSHIHCINIPKDSSLEPAGFATSWKTNTLAADSPFRC